MYLSHHIKILILTAIVLLQGVPSLYAQQTNTFRKSSYVQSYRLDERGSIVKCYQIAEDANGCIMTGTSSGLKMYDGRRWLRFYNNATTEMIRQMSVDRHNNIFVAGPECVGYFRPEADGAMKFNPLTVPFEGNEVLDIYNSDSDTGKTIYVLPNGLGIIDSVTVMRSLDEIETSVQSREGIIILCKNGTLYLLQNNELSQMCNLAESGAKVAGAQMAIVGDKLVVLCQGFVAYELDYKIIIRNGGVSGDEINRIQLTYDNARNCVISDVKYCQRLRKLAVSSNNGIYIFSNRYEYLQKIDKDINLPVNDILNIFFDSKNNLWASYAGGLAKIELNVPFVFYTGNHGVNEAVLSACTDDSNYFIGTVSAIYSSSHEKAGRNSSFKAVGYDVSDGQHFCWDFYSVDGIIVACTSCGLYQVYPDKALRRAQTGRTYGCTTSPLYPGKIFLTGFDGFKVLDYTIRNGQLIVTNIWNLPQSTRPLFKVQVDSNGAFWCSTLSDGLVRITPNNNMLTDFSLEYFDQGNGIENTNQLTILPVGSTIYINDGLFKRTVVGDPSEPVYFEPDTLLNKCFDKDELIYHFTYSPYTDEFLVYSQKYCRRISRSNPKNNSIIHFRIPVGTVFNISVMDSTLLYATSMGLVKSDICDTTFFDPAREPFNVIINTIRCNDENFFRGFRYFDSSAVSHNYNLYTKRETPYNYIDTTLELNCPYSGNSIFIEFSSSAYENREQVRYRYKLEGFDNDWTPWTGNTFKEYSLLPPGKYTFVVQARNCEDVISNEATFSFVITRPFWASIGAIVVYALLALIIIMLIVKKVTSSLKIKNANLSNLVSQRNKQLVEQNEKLRQMSFVATRSTNSVIIMDKDGNIQWINDSFKNIYGCSFDEFVYIHGNNYFSSYLSSDKKNQELIQLARQSNQNVTYETSHRYYNTVTWVQASLDTVFDDNGNLCNWILTETDITMLKRAQEEGNRQAAQLTEAFMKLQENQLQMEVQREELFLKNAELEKGYKKIEVQNNAITNSLRYAQQMQQSILPLDESISNYFNHFVIYMPKDIVSGDFYWFEPLHDGTLFFVVADCTGHGVPGAFMSLIGYNLLNEIIMIQDITQPKQIFERLSQGLINVLKQERNQNYDGMEVRLCRFVPEDNHYNVTFCGTGSSIFYYNSLTDEMLRIKGVHRHLGLTDETVVNNDFEEHEFVFNPEDKLFMITDGLVDQNNPQRKRFGTERFIKFVTDYRSQKVDEIGKSLKAILDDFMDGQPQRDDITVVGLAIK